MRGLHSGAPSGVTHSALWSPPGQDTVGGCRSHPYRARLSPVLHVLSTIWSRWTSLCGGVEGVESPTRVAGVNIVFVEPSFPQQPAPVRRRPGRRRAPTSSAWASRRVRPRRRTARPDSPRYYQVGNVTDPASSTPRPMGPGPDVGRPAGVDHRVAPDGRRPGPRGPRHPRHLGADDLAVPRQAVDEGGAAGRRACRPPRRPRSHTADEASTSPSAVGFPLILKPRAGAGAPGTDPGRLDAELHAALAAFGASTRSPSRSSSRVTRASTTPSRSTATSCTTGPPTTTPTCSRRCGTAGSRRSSSPPTGSTSRPSTPRSARWAPGSSRRWASTRRRPTWSGSTDPRGCGSPRSAAARPASGAWDLYSAANDVDVYREWAHAIVHGSPERAAVAAVLGRHRRAAARPGRPDPGLLRPRRDPAAARRVDHRRPPARPRHAHPAGRGGLHGQRLGPDEAPRLRHPARHARRRRPDGAGPRRMTDAADHHLPARAPALPDHRRDRRARARATADRSPPSPRVAGPGESTTPSSTRSWTAAAATCACTPG